MLFKYLINTFTFIFLLSFGIWGHPNLYQPVKKEKLNVTIHSFVNNLDSNTYLALSQQGALLVINTNSLKVERSLSLFDSPPTSFCFNSTDSLLAVASSGGHLKIIEIKKMRVVNELYSPEFEGNNFIAFSIADGFIYFNAHGRLYKVRSDFYTTPQKIFDLSASIAGGMISQDRMKLVFTSGTTLKVINTLTDDITQEINLNDHQNIEQFKKVNPNQFATWSADGSVITWNLGINGVSYPPAHWFKAGSPVPLAFNTQANWLLTAGVGYWIRVWDAERKTIFQELFAHQAKVIAYTFVGNEGTIISSDEENSIIKWSINAEPINPIVAPAIPSPEIPVISAVKPPLEGRAVVNTADLIIKDSIITLYIYDDKKLDGDTLSLMYNNEWLLENYGVNKSKKTITIKLQPNSDNALILFANTLGTAPPNTAVVDIESSSGRRTVRLSSDLKKCSSVNIRYSPN